MALIKCPECGKDVSDTCDACIHCGYKLHNVKSASNSEVKNDSEEIIASRDRVYRFIITLIVLLFVFCDIDAFFTLFFIVRVSVGDLHYLPWLLVFLPIVVGGVIVAILGIVKIKRNSSNMNPCLTYNSKTKTFTCYTLDYRAVKVPLTSMIKIKKTDKYILVVVYIDESGRTRRVKAGFNSNINLIINKVNDILKGS